jgi:TrmH family RNA methyltransferase
LTITSQHNQHLKEIRKLLAQRRHRDQTRRFVAEGEDLLAAADAHGWIAVERLVTAGSGLAGTEVDPKLLHGISGLASGTRALGIYEERWAPAPTGPLAVYLHGVHDPGNVGTILRSAEAFGASTVIVGPGTADPYGPKAVRASMGAVFAVAVARASHPQELPGTTIALVAGQGRPLREIAAQTAAATLVVGAEREGLPQDIVEAADHVATIPIATHSLNAAMAATVALYELSTHRMPRP